MEMREFILLYYGDLQALYRAREILVDEGVGDAAFCRILSVLAVSQIEATIEYWSEGDITGAFDKYLKASKNDEKVKWLRQRFSERFELAPEWDQIFEGYLAVKYLRNAFVHARLKDYEEEQLRKCGFPIDIESFTADHWSKIRRTVDSMMSLILRFGAFGARDRYRLSPLQAVMDCGHICVGSQVGQCCTCSGTSNPCEICKHR